MYSPQEMQLNILQRFNDFARSLRLSCRLQDKPTSSSPTTPTTLDTSRHSCKVYRKMKFLPNTSQQFASAQYSSNTALEDYIFNTKDILDEKLPTICTRYQDNLTTGQRQALEKLRRSRNTITIKPADKNLGVVVMDTDDYIAQCLDILTNKNIYRLSEAYPLTTIRKLTENIIAPFKEDLKKVNTHLYSYLTSQTHNNETPKFYGIPKVHKKFTHLPPMRPIVAQASSPLLPSAKLIDHVLQPLAQSYEDYIKNSTSLILHLQNTHVPNTAVLVTMDIENLYPSIPQTECLKIVYEEMLNRRHLILLDPNLIIRLLHMNVNFNYFQFADLCFQQIQGTAMGAAFSPTIANIYMSIFLNKFLRTQQQQPLLLARYIDDMFIIWPEKSTLSQFLTDLNSFHPNFRFTHSVSSLSVDFLDITIYKGPDFRVTNKLDIKTFQKAQNLYQYLEFTSAHPKNIYSSIILRECNRHLRNNSRPETFEASIKTFQKRLQERKYPRKCICKLSATIKFNNRQQYLKRINPHNQCMTPIPPLFKCYPPHQFNQLKTVILQNYNTIGHGVPQPRFVTLAFPSLKKLLVRAKVTPTTEQLFDILQKIESLPQNTTHTTSGELPILKYTGQLQVSPCNNPRCSTCTHLNCSSFFTSTVTKQRFPIRFSATCTSSNLIYLITCTKCKKQYVGLTTTQLNTRINHHRSNILRNRTIYLCIHFNFPDHSLKNLSVQVIDKAQSLRELQELEKYWIYSLKTLQPKGLNCSPGVF